MIDVHAHLTDKKFESDFDSVRSGYLSAGVTKVVDTGYSIQTSILAMQNARNYPEIYFTAGCHPDDAMSVNSEVLSKIRKLTEDKKCLAVGEIGLDYHYLNYDKQTQKDAFIKQLELAIEVKKPVVIHSREACKDTVDILKQYHKNLKGFLMHCYCESKETAQTLLDLGAYFSFGGVITFKNSKKEEIIKSIPINRILLETDCPYMAPVPYRGQINKPEYIVKVYEKLCEIYGVELNAIKGIINNNFERLFM